MHDGLQRAAGGGVHEHELAQRRTVHALARRVEHPGTEGVAQSVESVRVGFEQLAGIGVGVERLGSKESRAGRR